MKTKYLLLVCLIILPNLVQAQMERRKIVQDAPVEDIFMAGTIVSLSTVAALPAKNLSSSVMHNFGLISGGIDDFFGLDVGATVRLGLDYGLTDRLNIGIGRSNLENTVDLRAKYILLQQMRSDKMPVQLAVRGNVGINTQRERRFDYSFIERLNYSASVLVGRKFNEKLSLQVSPTISHFNTVVKETEVTNRHTLFALGVVGRYKLSQANAIAFEYLPVLGNQNPGTTNHVALCYEIDTGGHVFQIFLMSGQAFTEQHLIALTNSDISDFEFRIGFNINRVFGL